MVILVGWNIGSSGDSGAISEVAIDDANLGEEIIDGIPLS